MQSLGKGTIELSHAGVSPASLQVHLDIPIFVSNAVAAFGLNMSVFMLIGKTSALTMNIAGVIKDWLLIGLSVLIFKAQVLCLAASFTTCSPEKAMSHGSLAASSQRGIITGLPLTWPSMLMTSLMLMISSEVSIGSSKAAKCTRPSAHVLDRRLHQRVKS